MEPVSIRKASKDDLALVLEARLETLRAVFPDLDETELAAVIEQTKDYLASGPKQATYLAFCGDAFAACGTVCFYRVMPVCYNTTGERALIMNMYTRPAFRRRGISIRILDKLVEEARACGIDTIHLDASDMGKPMYEKYGFQVYGSEMYLPPGTN